MAEHRNTRQRQLVLDAVRSRCDHPTAEQVYADVHARDERVSLATVYRNLHLLAEQGAIGEVDAPGVAHFDLRRDNHPHLVCLGCGKVVDAPEGVPVPRVADVAACTGWQVSSCQLTFEGLCPSCAAKRDVAG